MSRLVILQLFPFLVMIAALTYCAFAVKFRVRPLLKPRGALILTLISFALTIFSLVNLPHH